MATITLPNSIVSPQDLARIEREVIQYADWFSHNGIKQELNIARGTAMPGMSSEAIALLRQVATDNRINYTNLEDLVATLKTLRTKATTMTVTLAAPAPKHLQQTIADWCRKEIDSSVFVEFRFNATLLGGMVVRYGSHIYDWSFRHAIMQNRHKFAEELRHV